ncbi:MAG TPA: DNA repair protein RecN [Acidimicrobiia bacterium]
MLYELHVVDLGIVADLSVLFEAGLTAITGETGAGKTLLVEALDLLTGGRADPGLVRRGAAEMRVEGRFADGMGSETILTRVVPAVGRSRAYIDGKLATAAELAAIGASLVDLHGQHANQSLLATAAQRDALDHFAGESARAARIELQDARAEERRRRADLDALGGDDRARARELDLLRFQLDEIAVAGIDDIDEEGNLEAEEALLADATAHLEALGRAYERIEGGALDAVGEAESLLHDRRPFADFEARLQAVHAELADLRIELRHAREGVVVDPERLAAIRERRQQLRELRRKYGETLGDVVGYADDVRRRIGELESYETRALTIDHELRKAGARAQAAASTLTSVRRGAAPELAGAVAEHLRELAMPDATLVVDIQPAELTDTGADDVTFLLSANAGEPVRSLAKVASGGELSRAMLALRLVLSDAPPTLVFDEVDAGIGGEAGAAVGRLLADLARRHQVLCVTHLAQVAAAAGAQIVVDKQDLDGRTVTLASTVTGDRRLAELSRMLAGVGESASARRHAAELLHVAAQRRDTLVRG